MRSGNLASIARVAFTFAGTLIGAGFASGQELLQFFITYGSFGIGGIFLAGLLFTLFAWRLLFVSHHLKLSSYMEFISLLGGKKFTGFFQCLVFCFLFAVLAIMLAGVGNVSTTLLHLPPYYGFLPFSLLVLWANTGGLSGITKINTYTTPFLALIIIIVSLHSLAYHDFSPSLFYQAADYALHLKPAPHWLLGCMLYVSYNMVLTSAILVPLAQKVPHERILLFGSLLGGVILTVLACLIITTLLIHAPGISAEQFPMLEVSCSQNSLHAVFYTIVLIIAMFTTSLSCLYGCAEKLGVLLTVDRRLVAIPIVALALCFANIGFSQLIAVFFPCFGYISLWLLLRLVMIRVRK